MVGSELTSIFDDFPGYTDWFCGEKALSWRKKHESEVLEVYRKLSSVIELVPDLIQFLQLLDDFALPITEYKARRLELVDILNNLVEEEGTG